MYTIYIYTYIYNIYVYVYVYIFICVYVYIQIYVHMYTHTCIYAVCVHPRTDARNRLHYITPTLHAEFKISDFISI